MSDIHDPQPEKVTLSDDHRDLDELGEKLRQVQESRKTKTGSPRQNDEVPASGLALGLRIGTELVVGVLVGLGIGWYLDRWLGTEPWGLLIFFVLGFAAGILNVVRVANKANVADGDGASPPRED